MKSARRGLILTVLAFCVAWGTAHGLDGGVLFLAPALLLALPLLRGRYPGAERLAKLIHRRTALRAPRALPSTRRPATVRPRGGELIARSLAVRPPPILAL